MGEYKLNQPPTDCISKLEFHPKNPNVLLVSSWDKKVREYNVVENRVIRENSSHEAAVLSTCYSTDGEVVYSGGLDCVVNMWHGDKKSVSLGEHKRAVGALVYNMNVDMLVSGSWDKTIGFWDASAPKALQDLIEVSERVYTLATVDNMLVAGLAGRQIMVYDLRNRSAPVETKESLLKYPTRKVTCMPNGQGFVVSSIEGRVAVEYFDPSPAVQSLKYAFKCHRKAVDGTDVVYPVNDMAFHPVHHTFVTGGSDGVVNLWDPVNKKRLKQYLGYPAGVSALDFNCSGNLLAIGSSYTFDQGDVEHLPDEVYIKEISESDVKPKPKSK